MIKSITWIILNLSEKEWHHNLIEYIAYTCKGKKHEKNEDRIFVDNKIISEGTVSGLTEDGLVAVICDGVGGNAGGEIAAEIVANSFKDIDIPQMSVVSLNKHIQRTNREILEEQKKHPNYKYSGDAKDEYNYIHGSVSKTWLESANTSILSLPSSMYTSFPFKYLSPNLKFTRLPILNSLPQLSITLSHSFAQPIIDIAISIDSAIITKLTSIFNTYIIPTTKIASGFYWKFVF